MSADLNPFHLPVPVNSEDLVDPILSFSSWDYRLFQQLLERVVLLQLDKANRARLGHRLEKARVEEGLYQLGFAKQVARNILKASRPVTTKISAEAHNLNWNKRVGLLLYNNPLREPKVEHRGHKRFWCDSVVEISPGTKSSHRGTLVNLSRSGARLQTDRIKNVGDSFDIELHAAKSQNRVRKAARKIEQFNDLLRVEFKTPLSKKQTFEIIE